MKLYEKFHSFDELYFHKDINKKIKKLVDIDIHNFLNIVFYGNNGLGKKTRIYVLLAEKFGTSIYSMIKRNIIIGKKKVEFSYLQSNYHIEIDFTQYMTHESSIINFFLIDYISGINIAYNIPKIVIINNAHMLKKSIQKKFSGIIDKYYQTVKFIFITEKRLIPNILNRSLVINFKNIKTNKIIEYLYNIRTEYNLKISDIEINELIIKSSKYI